MFGLSVIEGNQDRGKNKGLGGGGGNLSPGSSFGTVSVTLGKSLASWPWFSYINIRRWNSMAPKGCSGFVLGLSLFVLIFSLWLGSAKTMM